MDICSAIQGEKRNYEICRKINRIGKHYFKQGNPDSERWTVVCSRSYVDPCLQLLDVCVSGGTSMAGLESQKGVSTRHSSVAVIKRHNHGNLEKEGFV